MPMMGVLSLQGGVVEHIGHLEQLGIPTRRVRSPHDLEGLRGLIIPGGESTCLRRLLQQTGMEQAIRQAWANGLWVWGTCAGAILAAAQVDGEASCLELIDITIRRNAYGSQLASFSTTAAVPRISAAPVPLVFIRAPQITAVGPSVRVLLEVDGVIAAAESERVLVTVFHPELTPNLAFHRYAAERCGALPAAGTPGTDTPAASDAATWPRSVVVLDSCAATVGGTRKGQQKRTRT